MGIALSVDKAIGHAAERTVRRHHGRRLRRLGWGRALEPPDGGLWAAGDPPPREGCSLEVLVDGAEALPRLKSVISRESGGRGRVTVVLDLPSREVELALPGGFRIDPKIRAAVKSLPGILDVHDI